MNAPWRVERASGPAGDLHARAVPAPAQRLVWALEATRAALVLGSTQPASVVDRAAALAAGVDVVRRRSGGGAVLLQPGTACWVDVIVPRGDPLWDDDVARAGRWLGDAWAAALSELGVAGRVHHGAMVRSSWSDLVCFAGLGPGEVTAGGRKVVGVSQRRTRAAARFQCVVVRDWDPGPLLGLLALDGGRRAAAAGELAAAAAGVDRPAADVVAALVRHLP